MKEHQILDLLENMTLDEKVGQMVQIKGEIFLSNTINVTTGPLKDINLPEEMLYNVGSILNMAGAKHVKEIQDRFLAKNRLKIPLLFMNDIINGYKIAFPIPVAQGCSWNLELIRRIAKISAMEANVAGTNVVFSPMSDLVRDARWGRVMESIGGEDPYLGSIYTKAIVTAYQEKNISKLGNIASCVKHVAAYGAVESGRDYNTVDMSEREFRQYYLPAYKSAIDSKVEMVMTSFNILNGIPATINRWLIQDILRKELKYKGIIISDYGAIEETIAHGVSKSGEDAARNAINAGVDIDMMSKIYANYLKRLCIEDKDMENKVNNSVLRILKLKNKLGLFENPYGNADIEKEKKYLMNIDNLTKAKELTQETFVLLKNNNNILPLKENQKIAFIGPYIDNKEISGSWSIYTDTSKNQTILEVVQKRIEKNLYAKGCNILRQEELNKILKLEGLPVIEIENEEENERTLIEEAKDIAQKSEVIVLALGEHYLQTGEAYSYSNISLPENQINLINELYKLNVPIIMILFNGRPVQLNNIEDKLDAILEVWLPGTKGAESIVETLFGEANPSGKLTMSFPQNAGQCPIYYNHYNTGRPYVKGAKYLSRYQDIPTESFYPFGYGLSYCNFKYQNLELDKKQMSENDTITVIVQVKNQSNKNGAEVIQLYIQDVYGSVVRPIRELKAFKKEYFEPYEVKQIEFEINQEMLKFWNEKLQYIAEKGKFKIYVGGDSVNTIEEEFELV